MEHIILMSTVEELNTDWVILASLDLLDHEPLKTRPYNRVGGTLPAQRWATRFLIVQVQLHGALLETFVASSQCRSGHWFSAVPTHRPLLPLRPGEASSLVRAAGEVEHVGTRFCFLGPTRESMGDGVSGV